MKKIFSKEVVIGLSVLIALVVLFFGIDFLKGINVFKAANYYYVTYTNVDGLAISSPVTVNGYKVGQVREIEYEYDNPGHVRVEISLDRKLMVPQGSKAVLVSDLLGTASISLELASASENHSVGDTLIGKVNEGMMAKVGELMPAIAGIMTKVDTLLTNVNALVADPALTASVQRLDAITSNLQAMTQRLATVTAQLGPVMGDVKQITGNATTITEDLTALSGQLKELPLDQLVGDLQATTDNLRKLSTQLNDPNSTLGRLMNDPALYNNLNATISSLDSLFVDIKKNPKRYISIKLL